MQHPFFEMPTPTIFGHRGAAGSAPENTLPSFERALALGAHVIESDVHGTRDGVPVLIHDPDIDRTTDGQGAVSDFEFAELGRFDAAHHFSLDGGATHPLRGKGIAIPSLEQAFAAFPDARFNLEIKAGSPDLIANSLDLIAARPDRGSTLLTAGDDIVMEQLRSAVAQSTADPAIGACTADIVAVIRSARTGEAPPPDAMALQIPLEFNGRPLLSEALVAHAHRHGIAVHVWTINDPAEMRAVLDLGADGIITDHPERMVELLESRG